MKRQRKQLAELVGAHVAIAVISGQCTARSAVVGLSGVDRGRALELAKQLRGEARR
jgi:hypothetical protein